MSTISYAPGGEPTARVRNNIGELNLFYGGNTVRDPDFQRRLAVDAGVADEIFTGLGTSPAYNALLGLGDLTGHAMVHYAPPYRTTDGRRVARVRYCGPEEIDSGTRPILRTLHIAEQRVGRMARAIAWLVGNKPEIPLYIIGWEGTGSLPEPEAA